MGRRCGRGRGPVVPWVIAAFGAGVFLALFCSLKLVAVLAAALLVLAGAAAGCGRKGW